MFRTLTPSDEAAVGEAEFREALRQFPSGVTVITTLDSEGRPHGMTATAFCSLSLRPPLVLVAVGRATRCHTQVLAEKRFGVSILAADQAAISRHFGGRPDAQTQPAFSELNGVPILADAMVKLACRLAEPVEGGDHSIFVGLVTAAATAEGDPLVHYDGRYHAVSPLEGRD